MKLDSVIRELVKEVEAKNDPLLSLTEIRQPYFYEKIIRRLNSPLLIKLKANLEDSKITLQMLAKNDQTNVQTDCAFLIGQINSFELSYDAFMKEQIDLIDHNTQDLSEKIDARSKVKYPEVSIPLRMKVNNLVLEKSINPIYNINYLLDQDAPLEKTVDILYKAIVAKEELIDLYIDQEMHRLL